VVEESCNLLGRAEAEGVAEAGLQGAIRVHRGRGGGDQVGDGVVNGRRQLGVGQVELGSRTRDAGIDEC
jgi:hypothetical protein